MTTLVVKKARAFEQVVLIIGVYQGVLCLSVDVDDSCVLFGGEGVRKGK